MTAAAQKIVRWWKLCDRRVASSSCRPWQARRVEGRQDPSREVDPRSLHDAYADDLCNVSAASIASAVARPIEGIQ